jgi:hypothetical protein
MRSLPVIPVSLLAAAFTASAVAQQPCTITNNCRLSNFLHLLYVLAAVLSVILLILIAFALRFYANKKKSDSELPR